MRPSFQFYPADWLRDTGLHACSLAARGLWIDVLCFMHQGDPYGHLTFPAPKDGREDILRPIHIPVLARMVGRTTEEVEALVGELESAGVLSRNPEGVICSRRMIRDERLREIRAAGGAGSLKNPNVPRPKACQKDTLTGSLSGSFGVSPSSLSSSSSARESISSKACALDDSELNTALRKVWEYYLVSVRRDSKTYTLTPQRKRIGLARLQDCLGKTKGNLDDAVKLMTVAVDCLASSDWHMGRDRKTNGKRYCEWDKHLFKSYEKMEEWWNNGGHSTIAA